METANQIGFGFLAGMALIMFVVFIGFSLIINGWPKFGKHK